MLSNSLKSKIKELYETTPDYVGVCYGKKIKNNDYTGENCVIFTVPEKKSLNDIPNNEILPDKVIIDGVEYKTDVVSSGIIRPLDRRLGNNYAELFSGGDALPNYYSGCTGPVRDNCFSWTISGSPIFYLFERPIKGGLSLSSDNLFGSYGTLGFLCLDKQTQSIVGITNNHVVILDAFYTIFRNLYGPFENELTDRVYHSFVGVGNDEYKIGRVVRYEPIYPSDYGINYIDAAIVSLNQTGFTGTTIVDLNESYKIYGLTGVTYPLPFATTLEIDSIMTTNPKLYSVGTSSGIKENNPCHLVPYALNAFASITYQMQGYEITSEWEDLIYFRRTNPQCPYPVYPGDSGSVLIADFSGTTKIIGLVFAGFGEPIAFAGIACRIDRIVNRLGIEPWTGGTKNFIEENSMQFITVTGGSINRTLQCDGETYWQAGLTSYNNPCT